MYNEAKAEAEECFVATCEIQAEVSSKNKRILELEAKLQEEAEASAKKILELEAKLEKFQEAEARLAEYEQAESAYNKKVLRRTNKPPVYDSDDEPLVRRTNKPVYDSDDEPLVPRRK